MIPFFRTEIDLHLEEWGTTLLEDGDKIYRVFFAPRERGKGTMPTATTYGHHFKKAAKSAGLMTRSGKLIYTAHSLRHFFASTALANNIPILDVSRWLGHKSFKVTADIYGHLVPNADARFRTVMQQALRPAFDLAA